MMMTMKATVYITQECCTLLHQYAADRLISAWCVQWEPPCQELPEEQVSLLTHTIFCYVYVVLMNTSGERYDTV